MKKSYVLTGRLSSDEKRMLETSAASANMQPSQYIRTLINGSTIQPHTHLQEISSLLCRIYVSLEESGLSSNEKLMGELQQICQIL